MNRVLVIGGRGDLGRHIAARLGAAATVTGRAELDLAAGPGPITAFLRALDPDAVVNCAGLTTGSAAELAAANTGAVANLVAAVRAARRPVRVVPLGSAAEYGAGRPGEPSRESGPAVPAGEYGRTKLAGTELVLGSGLGATVLRVFNPVGPGAPPHSLPGRLVAEMRRAGRDGGPLALGPLGGHRDFVDVRDVAAAVAKALGGGPPLVNVGSGAATAVRDRVRAVAAEYRPGLGERAAETGEGSPRSATVAWQQADLSVARAWGWRPLVPFAAMAAALAASARQPETAESR